MRKDNVMKMQRNIFVTELIVILICFAIGMKIQKKMEQIFSRKA